MWDFIKQGGPIMFIILGFSVIALGLIIERLYTYLRLDTDTTAFFKQLRASANERPLAEIANACRTQRALVAHFAANLLDNHHRGPLALRHHATTEIDLHYQPLLQKRLNFLATIAKAAPMLGLFGTVWGMIGAFDQIAGQSQANAKDLAGDIAIALNTTFGGLGVAIPIVFALTYLQSRTQRFEIDLERCANTILDLVQLKESGEIPCPAGDSKAKTAPAN